MKKRIISIICVLGIMLTFTLTAFARGGWYSPRVSLAAFYNDDDSTVTLKVVVGPFTDLGAFQIKVNYDKSKLKITESPTASDLLPEPFVDYESVEGKVTYISAEGIGSFNDDSKTLLTIVFNRKDGAEGEANFSLSDMAFADSTGEYEFDTPAEGSITSTLVNIPDSSSSGTSSDTSSDTSSGTSSDTSSGTSSDTSSDTSSAGSSSSGSSDENSSGSQSASQPSSITPSEESSQPSSSEKPASSEPASSSSTTTSVSQTEPYTGDSISPVFYLLAALFVCTAAIFAVLTKKTYRRLNVKNSKKA